MTPKLRFVLSASLLAAGLFAVGACDPGTTAERTQAGTVAEPKPLDLERRIGDDAALPGSKATVTAVEWRRTLGFHEQSPHAHAHPERHRRLRERAPSEHPLQGRAPAAQHLEVAGVPRVGR